MRKHDYDLMLVRLCSPNTNYSSKMWRKLTDLMLWTIDLLALRYVAKLLNEVEFLELVNAQLISSCYHLWDSIVGPTTLQSPRLVSQLGLLVTLFLYRWNKYFNIMTSWNLIVKRMGLQLPYGIFHLCNLVCWQTVISFIAKSNLICWMF